MVGKIQIPLVMIEQQESIESSEYLLRRLQYRLRRQGMLELDAWLAPLLVAVETERPDVLVAIKVLLNYEAPDLLAMQAGYLPIPEVLKPWLKS